MQSKMQDCIQYIRPRPFHHMNQFSDPRSKHCLRFRINCFIHSNPGSAGIATADPSGTANSSKKLCVRTGCVICKLSFVWSSLHPTNSVNYPTLSQSKQSVIPFLAANTSSFFPTDTQSSTHKIHSVNPIAVHLKYKQGSAFERLNCTQNANTSCFKP